jgi:twitching motility two-component system response regulator PilG
MYHHSELSDFLDLLRAICETRQTASLVFFSAAGGWGKMTIRDGEIGSVRFGKESGPGAVRAIRELPRVQYHLRVEDPTVAKPPAPTDVLGSDRFFAYFEIGAEAVAAAPPPPPAEMAPPAPPPPAPPPAPTEAIRPYKILVADDSRTARKCISRVLIDHGYLVVEAGSGFEALGQLEIESPDLLILDLMMPGIDGYQVIEKIKKWPRFSNLPVLMLTARDSLLDRLRGRLSQSYEYLTKPMDGEALLEVVDRHLKGGPRR